MSASLFLRIFQMSLTRPVLYINGGWQMLVNGLRQRVASRCICPAVAGVATKTCVPRTIVDTRRGLSLSQASLRPYGLSTINPATPKTCGS
jgi:hypothetical protein